MARKKKRSRSSPPMFDRKSIIILLAVGLLILFVLLYPKSEDIEKSTSEDGAILMSRLTLGDATQNIAPIIVGNSVNQKRLNDLASKDYDDLKDYFGVQSDFVVYFEDDEGHIIEVLDRPCLGSTHGQVNGQQCR